MNAHRSRSLGMAALIFILISLTAAVFHGAAPVRAEDVSTPTPIVIDGKTADVTVELYTIVENRKVPLSNTTVLSTDTLYGSFSANFRPDHNPSAAQNVAEYSLPSNVKLLKDEGGPLYDGSGKEAGTWKCENNKLIFTFDQNWINSNPSEVHVGVDFSFKLTDENVGSGDTTKVNFPGKGEIDIVTKDGDVTGTKTGQFSQSGGEGKVTWTLNLEVQSYAHNVQLTDVLGGNFLFVPGSFKLNGETLEQQPSIQGQTATLSLDNLSKGTHTITYDSVMNPDVSVGNKVWINQLDDSKNNASWTWGGDRKGGLEKPGLANDFRYDMINKSDGTGTPSDITWTVTLNNGDIKTDMNGYTFTDTLDDKQTYTGNYIVYRGLYGEDEIARGDLDSPTGKTFSYSFSGLSDADKYQPYRIVYHTQMKEQDSYDTVSNSASISRDNSVSGTDSGTFTPKLVGTQIKKRLVNDSDAATTGQATWELRIALGSIVNAMNPSEVKVYDTFQTAWNQNIGPDVDSYSIKIGDVPLEKGVDWWFEGGSDSTSFGTKKNFNLFIRISDRVKGALKDNPDAVITYKTKSDALPGWYSNFASVEVSGTKYFTEYIYYYVDANSTPGVEKPSSKTAVSWKGDFDWSKIDGSKEKGAWIVDWTVYANRGKTPSGECYGAGKLDNQPLNVVDTLPSGMSYVPGSAKYSLFQNPYDQKAYNGTAQRKKTVADSLPLANVSDDKGTVTFSIPTTALGNYAGYAELTYQTAVKRGELDTSKNEVKFTNSASAESGNKKFDSGSGAVTIKNNVLQKTGDQVASSNRIKYTILVNESAVNLKSDSDYLELFDIMDAKCTLVTDSVNVSQYDGTGWKLLGSDECPVSARTIEDENGAACTKMTLRVPDKEYLKVEYEVIPAGNEGETVSLSNKASLTGVYDGDTVHSKDWVIQKVSGSAGGSGYGVTITKVDESDITKKLPGAEFTLYEVNMDKALDSGLDSAKTRIRSAETDEKGTVKFGNATQKMEAYKLYCLEETKAPSGYNVISKPVWILLKGNNEDDYQKALAKAEELRAKGVDIDTPTASTDITVCDAPYSGQATISATKMLKGSTLQESQFGFVLKDKKTGRVLQTIRNGADGDINFVLDYTKTGIYEYTISEVIPEGADENNVKDHITYDTTVHKVKVVVTNGEGKLNTVVTYDDTDTPTPPTFTNRYSTTLPEAGGAGLTMTYLAGASMLCFAATWMHARRHRDQDRGGRRE
jgi:pilin isopeptide linkage protein/fimbrial isopeptide formation D2 family protein